MAYNNCDYNKTLNAGKQKTNKRPTEEYFL